MVREAEIVVGAEAEDALPVDFDLRALGTGNLEGPTEQSGGFELRQGVLDLGLEAHGRDLSSGSAGGQTRPSDGCFT